MLKVVATELEAPQSIKGHLQETDVPKRKRARFTTSQCSLAALRDHTESHTNLDDFPLALEVVNEVLVYDWKTLPVHDRDGQDNVAMEWASALMDGPGVFCIKGAFANDLTAIDAANDAFNQILAKEKSTKGPSGDHFAKAGANSRIWNALEKLAMHKPDVFVKYYSNAAIALASRAWLGPNYQMTSQMNMVHPGGEAQSPHRDYHLGFQTNSAVEQYPSHVHTLSAMLTLQGAVAHCDMPLESGPTLFLPHSQKYSHGYLSWRLPEFKEYFQKHKVQIPLQKGDVVFFNPALFHAAGSNFSTNIHRMANLLQVSSAMGRAMESVDRTRMSLSIFPELILAAGLSGWTEEKTRHVVAACAEGYSFPTNLDKDVPIGGLAPETQAEKLTRAVIEKWKFANLKRELEDLEVRRCSH